MGILCIACAFSFCIGKQAGMQHREDVKETLVAVVQDVNKTEEAGKSETEETSEMTESQEKTETSNLPESQKDGKDTCQSEDISTTTEEQTEKIPEIDKSGILLVNKYNKLPEDYEVALKKLPDRTNQAAQEAYQPMCDMLAAARKEGLALEVCSSYRSVERQKELFEEDMRKLVRQGYSYLDAYDEVARETMPPGYSEHATGLAFDIVSLGYQILDEKQRDTAENKWLQEHCAEFGFILRYPEDKEEITGVSYESWHFRYVGEEAAEYIMDKEITLEEFLEE